MCTCIMYVHVCMYICLYMCVCQSIVCLLVLYSGKEEWPWPITGV